MGEVKQIYDQKIANVLLPEINNRLAFLMDVGLSYLNLNRKSNSCLEANHSELI
jgi:excinuclease UvrABC ATPase subunit